MNLNTEVIYVFVGGEIWWFDSESYWTSDGIV